MNEMAYVCGNRRGIGNHGELRSRKVAVNRLLAGGKWWGTTRGGVYRGRANILVFHG